jgi:tetratricopeptide (TPR) repeat protein
MAFIFKHALIQEVVYNSMLQKRRQELHGSIGQSIERLYYDRLNEMVEVLAYHYQQGNFPDKAVEYMIKSGKKALDRFAVEESHKYYEQAFKALSNKAGKTQNDRSVLLDIVLSWAEVYYYRGYFRELLGLLSSYKDLAEDLGDEPRRAMLLGWMGNILFISARNKESYQCLRQALDLAETSNDQKSIAYVCSWLVWTCLAAGLIDEATKYGEKALMASRQVEDAYPYIKSMGGMGYLFSLNGKTQKALECSQELLEFGQTHGNMRSLALGYYVSGMCCSGIGDLTAAIGDCQKGLDLNVDPIYNGMLKCCLGFSYFQYGRFQEAEAVLDELVEISLKFGGYIVGRPCKAFLGLVLISRGQMKKGLDMVDEFDRISREDYLEQHQIFSEFIQAMLYTNLAAPVDWKKIPLLLRNIGIILRRAPFATKKTIYHYQRCAAICQKSGNNSSLAMTYLELGRLYQSKRKRNPARENLLAAARLFQECEARLNQEKAEVLLRSLDKK